MPVPIRPIADQKNNINMDFKKSFFSLSRISNKEIQSENESNSISSNSNDNNLFVNN